MRRLATATALLLCFLARSEAQDSPARFAIAPSDDGFIRLDTTTGAITHCARRDGVWQCDILAEERAAADARIAVLTAEVEALRAKVEALTARLDAFDQGAPVARPLPGDDELDRAMGFSETLMRRFFGLVRELKRESAGD